MDFVYKIILLGDSGVGKSSIVKCYLENIFTDTYVATKGVQYFEKFITENEGEEGKIAIWDTTGKEMMLAIKSPYYGGAMGVLLVFDLTNLESFKNVTKWYNEIATHANASAVFLLVGTKRDLKENRQVSTEEAINYAKSQGFIFYETSSLCNENVEEVFKKLKDEIYARKLGRIYHLENQSTSDKNETSLINLKEYPRPKLITPPAECCPGGITSSLTRCLLKCLLNRW